MSNLGDAGPQTSSTWLLLMKSDEERSWQSNRGYDDAPGSYYSYDSNVGRHLQLAEGDLVVIREDDYIVGCGVIEHVSKGPAEKEILRCPFCQSTNHYPRSTVSPESRFRCSDCKAEFAEPERTWTEVVEYRAHYADTWRPLAKPLHRIAIEDALITKDTFNAIRPLDRAKLPDVLEAADHFDWTDWINEDVSRLTSEIAGGLTEGKSKARIGQVHFRQALLTRFGEVCAISGPQPAEVLEAAHLYSYAEDPVHDLAGGLLLRRDLHTLFDRFLLAIDPADWTVRVSNKISAFPEYQALDGTPLAIPATVHPNPSYLDAHYSAFLRKHGDSASAIDWEGVKALTAFFEEQVAASHEELAATTPRIEEISHLLAPLDAREREILKLRFGLDSGEPRSLEEVAEHFGMTHEQVRQREVRAMSRLRHILEDSPRTLIAAFEGTCVRCKWPINIGDAIAIQLQRAKSTGIFPISSHDAPPAVEGWRHDRCPRSGPGGAGVPALVPTPESSPKGSAVRRRLFPAEGDD